MAHLRRWAWRAGGWWLAVSILGSVGLLPLWKWLYNVLTHELHDQLQLSYVPLFGLMAIVIGLGQWAIVRPRISRGHLGWWIVGSVAYMLVIVPAVLLIYDSVMSVVVWAGLVGAIVGVLQWRALQPAGWALRWILATTLGCAVGWPTGWYVGSMILGLTWGAIGGWIGSGTITGMALAGLLQRETSPACH